MKPHDQTQPPKPAASPQAKKEPIFPALALASTPPPNDAVGVEMADGTIRTPDQAVVSTLRGRLAEAAAAPKKRTPILPPPFDRYEQAVRDKLPPWGPKAILVTLILLIMLGFTFYAVRSGNLFGLTFPNNNARTLSLPSNGTVPSDGRKYDVSSANFQFDNKLSNWTTGPVKDGEGKVYTSLDGTCKVDLTRLQMTSSQTTVDDVLEEAEQRALTEMKEQKAEILLPSVTLGATKGSQVYEFTRKRLTYVNQASEMTVSEIAVRTLGGYKLLVTQTCAQSAWDQSQASRNTVLSATKITVE